MVEYCECCGAKVVKYWHRLNKGLCGAIIKIYSQVGKNPIKISDILTHNQSCNFQKLKYWSLVEKVGDQGKGGQWKLTEDAEAFIKREISLPKKAQTFRGKTVSFSPENVYINEIFEGYQFKEDYLKEAE